ncbi:uncharacterized protein LOC127738201 [Mytilus californianus]|uniref:Globin domain-containing protein n=1 Tax=Mytilus coruscus TaxID=42192 RepID=A0A6J8AKQ3_MYTCO|nr:uncharacterized protein LOC127738201 [Mytilus californianus]CAC5368102.1 unnamed protein product [Mytilus coruscus]
MGCINTKRRKDALRKGIDVTPTKRTKNYLKQNNEQNDSPSNGRCHSEPFPEFTDRQKQLVVDSWKIIQEDMSKVGVVMFMKLFETHPDVQEVFMPFKGMTKEDLQYSNQLKTHALRVMGTVDKCLARIDDKKKVQEMLHDLGSRHAMYNAKVDYIDLIGPQFIWAIQPALKEQWNSEVEEAWSDLFKLISQLMKTAMTF